MNASKTVRLTAWLLTMCTLVPTAVSCAADDDTAQTADTTVAQTAADTEPLDALDARKLVDDGLGEYDFEGYEFRIGLSDGLTDDYYIESETGDIVDDAVYQRNAAVEERFNCEIAIAFDLPYGDGTREITQYISAGEDAFDMVSYQVVQLGALILNDFFLNWYDIPNIDFTKPWWSDSTIEDLTYNGICISAIGDMALSALYQTYCVFYNKKLGADYDFPDLYEVVNNGEWTIDYITQLTKDVYKDLDQNGKVDCDTDFFGYTSDILTNVVAYQWAFDNPIFRKNGDVLEYAFKSEKINDIVQKIFDTFTTYNGIRYKVEKNADGSFAGNFGMIKFAAGQSVLSNGTIGTSLNMLRDMEDEYGILPYPKWDTAQENYMTMSDGSHHVMAVPITISDPEKVGTIIEALCAESYKTLVPAYYDVALKVKGTRDEQSVEMLDMIVNSCVFDFGYVYDAWKGPATIIFNLVAGSNRNFESYYARKERSIDKHYSQVIDYFENYGS